MATEAETAFLKLARDRFELAKSARSKQLQREIEDLRFYAGEQWDDTLLKSRGGQTITSGTTQQVVPARPSLTINKTIEPVRQVLNQERQSDLGIELIPADDWGDVSGEVDHTEIELREGLVRRIQRDSEAADARTWGFARSTIAGTGFWLVLTRYVKGKTQDQEVYVDRIYNQSTVLLDPSHEQQDGSDAEWGFWGTDMLQSAFKVEYPKAKAANVDDDEQWRTFADEAPNWFSGEGDKRGLRVMNYVYAERTAKELYHLTNGGAAYDDELADSPVEGQPRVLKADPSVMVMVDEDGAEQCHTEMVRKVKWAKITGCDVLETTDWPSEWLPIIKTVAEELQPYDDERRSQGVVRPMLDACKGNNYIISKFVERVGLTPIPPIMMAEGQDEGYEDEYNAINTRTLSRIHYKQKDLAGQPAPPPFRLESRAEISDIGAGLQMFGQAIQATSVVPETALGNTDATVKSGKLARALIERAEQGTSNFLDNLVRSLRHEARVINSLLYPIYGRPGRMARMINGQGDTSSVLIGKPFTTQGSGKLQRPVPVEMQDGQLPDGTKLYKLTPNAGFNIAVKISKSIETRRQQIAEFLGNLVGASPEQMQVIGDILWKYLDIPEHEKIEERYKLVLLPAIQELVNGKQGPNVQQLQQQLSKAGQMIDLMAKQLEALTKAQETDQVKADAAFREKQLQEQAENERTLAELAMKERLEMRKLEVQLEIEMAKLGSAQSMKRAELEQQALHQHDELAMRQQEQESSLAQADMDRQAERDEAASERAFQAGESAQDRELAQQAAQQSEA